MRAALTTHGVGTLGADVEASADAFEPAVGDHRRHWRRVGARVRTVDAVPRRGEPGARERRSGAARHASGATWRGPSACERGRLGARLPTHAGPLVSAETPVASCRSVLRVRGPGTWGALVRRVTVVWTAASPAPSMCCINTL